MVMMYVPYPSLPDSDRLAALTPLDLNKLRVKPSAAISSCPATDLTTLRLIMFSNRPAYACHTANNTVHVVYGDNGKIASQLTQRELEERSPSTFKQPLRNIVGPIEFDQWIVAQKFNAYRPFFRFELDDVADTHFYVSARTGEVLQRTTQKQRIWNYLGAVLHWIYPTVLRKDHAMWDMTVWWLSLVALLGTVFGVYLSIYRTVKNRQGGRHGLSSFKEKWMRWHHILGLFAGVLVLSWIFSGWLSMDHGRLFSTLSATQLQQHLIQGKPLQEVVKHIDLASLASLPPASEVTIYAFNGTDVILARDKSGLMDAEPLELPRIRKAIGDAWPNQRITSLAVVSDKDVYTNLREGQLPVGAIRAVLGNKDSTWVHVDAFSGEILSVMDRNRRLYRWLFNGLHSLDFPGLTERRPLWDAIMLACLFAGFSLSLTGIVIGFRRLRSPASRR